MRLLGAVGTSPDATRLLGTGNRVVNRNGANRNNGNNGNRRNRQNRQNGQNQ